MQETLFKSRTAIILWLALTTFFAFQFILRLAAGILREDIMRKFSIDTASFGQLAGFYYLAYSGMQIPIGYLLDRYNIKYISFLSILITALGAFIFGIAENWTMLLIGRSLIGMGSAAGFLSVAKASTAYFPEKYKAFLIGLAFTFGLIGAVTGGIPTKTLFDYFGIKEGLIILGCICLVLGFIILMVKTDHLTEYKAAKTASFSDILALLVNPVVLFAGVCGGLMVGALEGFADVWSLAYFNQIYRFSEENSIQAAFVLYIGMCVGGPLLAYLAEKLKSEVVVIFGCGLLVSVIFMILFVVHEPSIYFISSLMFILGITCCYQVLVFTTVSNLVPKESAAVAIAIVNCINMSFGYFFHTIVSLLIHYDWSGAMNSEYVPVYDISDFMAGLRAIPILNMVGAFGFLLLSSKLKNEGFLRNQIKQ
ncbi:MAG: MFS transporter [Rickettsiaceae bacterium]|nr:MFS transporter [Rickettsiaceae bacterium]